MDEALSATAKLQDEIYARSARSVGALFQARVATTPALEAFRYPDKDEVWHSLDWTATKDLVYTAGAALLAEGFADGDRVAIASTTRIEWIIADYAIMAVALASTTIYPNTNADDVDYILTDCGARLVFAENDEQVEKVLAHGELKDQIVKIVVFAGETRSARIVSWEDFLAGGRAYLQDHPACVDDAIARTDHDTLSTLIYTSGTTGRPKGVRLNHGAWTYLVEAVDLLKLVGVGDLQFLWLPLSHVFGKSLTAFQLGYGFTTAVDGRIDKIVDNLPKINPTFMCGAPRIFEKVRAAALTGETSRGVKGKIARWAFHVGREAVPYTLAKKPLPKVLAAQHALADKLVFSQLRKKMGGNIHFMISGSAKLSPQVQRWFIAAGITVVEGYGLTETSAVSFVNHWNDPVPGSLGPAIPGLEVKFADDGEVCLRGPVVMTGYHNNPEATAEVLDADGWFHTGDIGHYDEHGMLVVTDRKKDLLKTSGGKYVAPAKVEGAIIANVPFVSQVVVVGDGHKYVGALLVLEPESLMSWGQRHGYPDATYAELTRLPQIHASIDKRMARANAQLERWETVKRYAILDHELTVEDGAMTPNMKIRRQKVIQQYADIVDSLFTDAAEQ